VPQPSASLAPYCPTELDCASGDPYTVANTNTVVLLLWRFAVDGSRKYVVNFVVIWCTD